MDSQLAIHGNQNLYDLARLPFKQYLKQHELLVKHLERISKEKNGRR